MNQEMVDTNGAQLALLLEALQAFLGADNWADSRRVLEQHPELLDDEADALLGQMIAAQDDEDAIAYLEQHRELLRRCREVGVEQTFVDMMKPSSTGSSIPAEFHEGVRQAMEAQTRYRRTGDRQALDKAVAAWRRIWEHPAFGEIEHAFRLAALNDGAGVLLQRYWATGTLADLSEAIQCWEQAVEQASEGSPEKAAILNNLGTGLRERYARTGDLADLRRAIDSFEQAVAQTPTGSPDLPGYLNNLGTGLSDRYARTGELDDLTQAIEFWEQAVEQAPEGSPEKAAILNNLGTGLRERYARTGDLVDLRRAIDSFEQAVAQTPTGSPDLPSRLNNLGTGLRARYARTGELADLERAIEAYEQAVRQAPDSPDRARYQYNLGFSLLYLAEAESNRQTKHLSRAANALQRALSLEVDPLLRARTRYHLGRCYAELGRWDEAISVLEQARKAFTDHKTRPELAHTLLELGQLHSQMRDFESANIYLKDALRLFRRLGDTDGVAVTQEALGNLALQTARPAEAIEVLEKARQGYETLDRRERVREVDELLDMARQARQAVGRIGVTP